MRFSLRALEAALAAALALAAPAFAQQATFEQWDVDWAGFADDFADGVFTSGPNELYNVACGTATETGGRLVVGTATSPCTGFEVRPLALVPGGLVLRALISLPTIAEPTAGNPKPGRIPPTTQGRFGIAVRNQSGNDAVFLHVRRSNDVLQCAENPCEIDPTFGTGGNDVLYVELADESGRTVSRTVALTVNPSTSEPTMAVAFDLELTLTPSGTSLLPSARFRECTISYLSGGPCLPTDPFVDLIPVLDSAPSQPDTVSPDGGALAAGVVHFPALYASAPGGPFAVRIDDWDLAMDAADDFSTPLGSTLPYQTSTSVCGAANVAGGGLMLGAGGGCPKVIAAANGYLTSDTTAEATLRYSLPPPCNQRGVSLAAGPDQANLSLVRDADGSLALWLTSEPAAGGTLPLVERTVLSATPASDATLTSTAAIELRLALADDGLGARAPHGQYRLCPTSPCAPAVAFQDLDPATEPAPVSACFDLAIATDGGSLPSDVPVSASLFMAPEPNAVALAIASTASLAALRARRRS